MTVLLKRITLLLVLVILTTDLFCQKVFITTSNKNNNLHGKELGIYLPNGYLLKKKLYDNIVVGNSDTIIFPVENKSSQFVFFKGVGSLTFCSKNILLTDGDTLTLEFNSLYSCLVKQTRQRKNELFSCYTEEIGAFTCDMQKDFQCFFAGLDSIFLNFKKELSNEYRLGNINKTESEILDQTIGYYIGSVKLQHLSRSPDYWKVLSSITKPNLELNNITFINNPCYHLYLHFYILEKIKNNEKYIEEANLYLVRKLFDELIENMRGECLDLAIAILFKESYLKFYYTSENYEYFVKLYSDFEKVCTNKNYYTYHYKHYQKAYNIK